MLFEGKKGLIVGVANQHSIAAGIAHALKSQGADIGFTHLPDTTGKMETRVRRVVDAMDPKLLTPCDVNSDADLEATFQKAKEVYGELDFVVHSVAFAPLDDIRNPVLHASREGFQTAMETSVYSLIAVAKYAKPVLAENASILALSYYGGEKVIPGYNLMGVAKAGLDMAVKYLASDLGPEGIRVNAISAGPIKTLASSAVGSFGKVLEKAKRQAPLARNVTQEDVGKASLFLLGDLGYGVTGEILHVDSGYNIMGSFRDEHND